MVKADNIVLNRKKLIISIVCVLAVIAAVVLYMNYGSNLLPGKALASVNGEKIYEKTVIETQSIISKQTGQNVNESAALKQEIGRVLLLQEVKTKGISTNKTEAEALILMKASQQGMSMDDLKSELKKQGSSYNDLVKAYQEQLNIQKLSKELMASYNVTISDAAAIKFFNENKQAITQTNSSLQYKDISVQIKDYLLQIEQQKIIIEHIKQLEAEAKIEYY
jgi:hypothetical protein